MAAVQASPDLMAAAVSSICPWSFLAPLSPLPLKLPSLSLSSPQRKSFAQAVSKACDITASQLPKPCLKGDAIAIRIPEEEYKAGLEGCKNHLHGQLILSKGDAPIKIADLRNKLLSCWKTVGKWTMISLGKGFYEFSFATSEDMHSVFSTGSWVLKPGILRLSLWSPDFNPLAQTQTHAQVWVRILGLPQEYWRAKIIFSIASGIGTPIALDEATSNKTYGHFARVLVDIDLNGAFRSQILVERQGYEFFVGIEYEKLPAFCSQCQKIGHSLSACRSAKTSKEATHIGNHDGKDKTQVASMEWKQVENHNPENANDANKAAKTVDQCIINVDDNVVQELDQNNGASLVNKDRVVDLEAQEVECDVNMSLAYEKSGDNLVHQNLDDTTLNKDVQQAIHDVFDSPNNIDSSSFVADSVGDMEKHANVAHDSVNCNHATASDTDEEVVQCTPLNGAQQHCIKDFVHAATFACQPRPFNSTPVIAVDDLSSFSAAVQNDVKVLSAWWAKEKGASTSQEAEQNIDNVDGDGFTMVKPKNQKKYNPRLNRRPNSRFA